MEIKQCSREIWDAFAATSPQGTIYCQTVYLDTMQLDYDLLLLVDRNNAPQLGVIILKKDGKVVSSTDYLTPHQGLLMKKDAFNIPNHRFSQWLLDNTSFMLENLSKRYNKLSFSMHPRWADMRPFQWFNYHDQNQGLFNLNLRYTAYADFTKFKDYDDYFMSLRQVRRYEYRQAVKNNLVAEESDDVEALCRIDTLTFTRQGITPPEMRTGLVKRIATSALRNNYGRLIICKDPDQHILSASLFLYDERCAYYVVGANDPQYRDTFSGTFLIFEQLKYFFNKKTPLIDFVGANSPQRGDFKMSFNLSLVSHYWAEWFGNQEIRSN